MPEIQLTVLTGAEKDADGSAELAFTIFNISFLNAKNFNLMKLCIKLQMTSLIFPQHTHKLPLSHKEL